MLQPSIATLARGHPLRYPEKKTVCIRRYFLAPHSLEAWNKFREETVYINHHLQDLAEDWTNHPNLYNSAKIAASQIAQDLQTEQNRECHMYKGRDYLGD